MRSIRESAKAFAHKSMCCIVLLTTGCVATGEPTRSRPVPYLAMRYEATVRQSEDFTCGAASLATLLTFYWGRPTTETEVLRALATRYSARDLAMKTQDGLSFDDLIYAANQLGYAAQGVEIEIGELSKLEGPVIVHLQKTERLQHFVVLRKVGDGVYYLSDPIVGQVALQKDEFADQYTRNALVVWRKDVPLPVGAKLDRPRDGLSVSGTLRRVLNPSAELANHL